MSPQTAWSSSVDIREKRILNGGFYESIRLTLLTCRFIGLLPMSGLLNQSSKLTKCTWKSFYSLIYVTDLLLQVLMVMELLISIVRDGLSIQKISIFQFAVTFLFGSIIPLRLCIKWRTLITEIEGIERKLPHMIKPRKAVYTANVTMFTVQLCWAAGYCLYLVATAKVTILCYIGPDDSDYFSKPYRLINYSWFYDEIPFKHFSGVIIQVLHAQGALVSNFITILVAIASMYLTNRFQTFNKIFFHRQNKSRHNKPSWMELQIYYARLTRLTHIINDHLHPFVFITFWTNLFYISLDTYYTLNKLTLNNFQYSKCFESNRWNKESLAFSIYFFICAVSKLSLVWYLAAKLHATSRKPLNALYTVSSKAYTVEMQRLLTQIYRTKICLTGLNLFHITRGTLLSMMATILTYELVLLQI